MTAAETIEKAYAAVENLKRALSGEPVLRSAPDLGATSENEIVRKANGAVEHLEETIADIARRLADLERSTAARQ